MYKCSKCGWSVIVTILTSFPAQTRYSCNDCWASKIEQQDWIDTVIDFNL